MGIGWLSSTVLWQLHLDMLVYIVMCHDMLLFTYSDFNGLLSKLPRLSKFSFYKYLFNVGFRTN